MKQSKNGTLVSVFQRQNSVVMKGLADESLETSLERERGRD